MNRSLTVLLALALLAFGPVRPAPASAQLTPADSAEVLLDAASRFSAEGRQDIAQALYRHIVQRFPGTPAAAVAVLRLGAGRVEEVGGSGKVELQVWSTLYGLWLGVAVPGAFGADSSEPYGLGLLLGGPAGFVAGKALARSRPDLTIGQARAITLGGTWGTWQGWGWAEVFDLGTQEVCVNEPWGSYCYEDGDSSEEKFAAMILGGAAGIATGAVLARRPITPGVATSANFGSLWGSWLGFGLGYLADWEDDTLLAATLLGGNGGLAVGAVGASRLEMSRSRSRIVSIYGVIGGLAGAGVDLLARPDDDKVAMAIPLAGSVVGLALGVANTRDYDAPSGVGGVGNGGGAGAGSGADAAALGGGLLNYANGSWSVDAPMLLPRVVEMDGPRGTVRRPALGVNLFSARFF